MPRQFWLMRRCWSEKARHHRGYQPWVYKPIKEFPIGNIPTTRLGLRSMIHRILSRYGASTYLILREQFIGEKSHFRGVLKFQVRPDGKYRILQRYTQFKGTEDDPQPFFKLHAKRLFISTDSQEQLRNRQRNMLKHLEHRVATPKPFVHTIRSSTSNRPWKATITVQTQRRH